MTAWNNQLRRDPEPQSVGATAITGVASLPDQVLRRLTAAEMVRVCNHYSLLSSVPTVGSGAGEMPATLSGDGALTWMDYNRGSGAFYSSITALTEYAELTAWWDAQHADCFKSDSAGTTNQTSDDGRVGLWVARHGSQNLIQTSESAPDFRPTLKLNAHRSFKALRFDPGGSNHNEGATHSRMMNSTGNWTSLMPNNKPFTIFMAMQNVQNTTTHKAFVMLSDTGGNSTARQWINDAIYTVGKEPYGADFVSTGIADRPEYEMHVLDRTPHLIVMQAIPGGNLLLNIDGGTAVTASTVSATMVNNGALCLPGIQTHFKCRMDVFELAVFSGDNANYNTAAINTIAGYFVEKYGIPWWAATYRYLGGCFASQRRAVDVRTVLRNKLIAEPKRFINAAVAGDHRRATELTRDPPPSAPGPLAPRSATNIVYWNSAAYSHMETVYPTVDSRSNMIVPVQVQYGLNGGDWDELDSAYIKGLLDSEPAGRRWIKCGEASSPHHRNHPWAIPTTVSANNRYAFYDAERATINRIGTSLESWIEDVTDPDGKFMTFLDEILAATNSGYLNGILGDVERLPLWYHLRWGTRYTTNSGATTDASRYVCSIDTGTNVITTQKEDAATTQDHGFTTGDPCHIMPLGTLPTGLEAGRTYFVRAASASTLTLHPSATDATGNTKIIAMSTTGSSTVYIVRDGWGTVFQDTAWTGSHGNLATGVRGAIAGGAMCQGVFRGFHGVDATDHEEAGLADTWFYTDFMEKLSQLYEACAERFPAVEFSEYSTQLSACGIHSSQIPNGSPAGARMYGPLNNPFIVTTHTYGDQYNGRWNWNTLSTQADTGATEWDAFLTQIMRIRQVTAAAPNVRYHPWLATEWEGGSTMGDASGDFHYWQELILHLTLMASGHVYFYNLSAPTQTFTAEADDDLITATAHGLENGDTITVATSSGGSLPGNLSAGTLYFVRDKTDNTFKVSTTSGGAAVNISSDGSGTQTMTKNLAYEQKRVVDLVAEADTVIKYTSVRDGGDVIENYSQGWATNRAWAGGRWVWRVTPNQAATGHKVFRGPFGVTFTCTLGGTARTLSIPGGEIHSSSQSALAPYGYWVLQRQ